MKQNIGVLALFLGLSMALRVSVNGDDKDKDYWRDLENDLKNSNKWWETAGKKPELDNDNWRDKEPK